MLTDKLTTIPTESIEEQNFRFSCPKRYIISAIKNCYSEQPPLWFYEGRMPNRHYLLNVLSYFDPVNSALGRVYKLPGKLRSVSKTKYKECFKRSYNRFKNRQAQRQIKEPNQPLKTVLGFLSDATRFDIAKQLLLSIVSNFLALLHLCYAKKTIIVYLYEVIQNNSF